MPDGGGNETKPTTVIIGPAAVAGVVLAVRAIHRRSYSSAVWARPSDCSESRLDAALTAGCYGEQHSAVATRMWRLPSAETPTPSIRALGSPSAGVPE
jgi:hypothetical protein